MAISNECTRVPVRRQSRHYWPIMLALLLAGLTIRLFIHYAVYDFYADDSYIFMRYARNAANGDGLIFNPGEPVLGFTSTTFVTILAAIASTLRFIPLEEAVNIVNTALFIVGSLFLVAQNRRDQPMTYLVPLIWFLYVPFVDGAVNGMETMLFIALQLGAVWALCTGRFDWAALAAFLTALTRPEGVLVMIAMAVVMALRRPSHWPWRGVVVGGALSGAWVLYATITYGSPIPQSMIAKSTLVTGDALVGATNAFDKAVMMSVGISSNQYGALSVLARGALCIVFLCGATLFAIGARELAKGRSYSLVFPIFWLLNWLFYVIGAPVQIWSWYVVPSTLAFAYTALLGVGVLVETSKRHWLAPALSVAMALAMVASLPYGVTKRRDSLHGMTLSLLEVARHIQAHHPDARSIMIGDIGIVGYRCAGRVIDMGGLVSPMRTLRDEHGRSYSYTQIIAREKPDIVSIPNRPGGRKALDTFNSEADRKFFETEYAEEFSAEGGYIILARRSADH